MIKIYSKALREASRKMPVKITRNQRLRQILRRNFAIKNYLEITVEIWVQVEQDIKEAKNETLPLNSDKGTQSNFKL